jgi:hypothetical protein
MSSDRQSSASQTNLDNSTPRKAFVVHSLGGDDGSHLANTVMKLTRKRQTKSEKGFFFAFDPIHDHSGEQGFRTPLNSFSARPSIGLFRTEAGLSSE